MMRSPARKHVHVRHHHVSRGPLDVGLAPSVAWRAVPLRPLAHKDPSPTPAWPPPPGALQEGPGEGEGGEGRAVA